MASERFDFLNLVDKPGRFNPEEAAWFLGFSAHDIPILVTHKMLKPLGNPPPNGGRYFALADIEKLRNDPKWLDKASAVLIKHWKAKNETKRSNN